MKSQTESDVRSTRDSDVAVTPFARFGREYDDIARSILNEADFEFAKTAVMSLPGYAATPLVRLDDFAARCGVSELTVKLEGERAPTGSFKVLGPPFALAVQLARRLSGNSKPDISLVTRVIRGECARDVAAFTTVAATSGNHGRALAWAAHQFGCRCLILMPEATGSTREQAIRGWGAETRRIPGVYDRAVSAAVDYARSHNAILVGDGAGEESGIRRHILHGYAVLGHEWMMGFSNDRDSLPTHLFQPAGSGTLAAGITARWWMRCGTSRPRIIIVQPRSCDSAIRSTRADRREPTSGDTATFMDGLSVGRISNDAWRLFRSGVFGYLTISETAGLRAFREAAEMRMNVGETGIAAFAGMLAATQDEGLREQLEIDATSRISLIATEGITDPEVYEHVLQRARCVPKEL